MPRRSRRSSSSSRRSSSRSRRSSSNSNRSSGSSSSRRSSSNSNRRTRRRRSSSVSNLPFNKLMKVLQERAQGRPNVRHSSIYVLSADNLSQFRQKYEPRYRNLGIEAAVTMFENKSNEYIKKILSANKERLDLESVNEVLYNYISSYQY